MATGDVVLPTRPRGESNMRLDLVDYASMALAAQYAVEAATRAMLSKPRATAGVATGERWAGSMTANPTSGSDGLFRLDSTTFVGVDANGGLVVKPNGTSISVAIPAGGSNQQVYAYVSDVAENSQVRRFLPATSPFNEFAQAINVALRQTIGLYVRAGSLGSVVAEDTVAGITRPLLFLGIASNTGGVVTFTPGTNTLETVRAPTTVPATDSGTTTVKTTVTGSSTALRDLINAALYAVGNAMWKGSTALTPADANNWGAYSIPTQGFQKIRERLDALITNGGATTGSLDLRNASEATVIPLVTWRDYAGKTRATIDHNGYRMGQVTEKDEHWEGDTETFRNGLAGSIAAGAPTFANGVWKFTAAAQQVSIPLSYPDACIITSIKVSWFRTTLTDTLTIDLENGGTSAPTSITQVLVTSGGSSAGTAEMLTGRNLNIPITASTGLLQIRTTCTAVTTSAFITGITVTYMMRAGAGWTVQADSMGAGTGTDNEDRVTLVDPDTNINHRSIKLASQRVAAGGGTAGSIFMFTSKPEGLLDANCAFVMEYILRTGTITDATDRRRFGVGISLGSSGTESVFLFNNFTVANWQLRVVGSGGASTVDTDTGVAIAANTNYRIRLEIYGASLNSSGSYKVRLYINGTKVAEVNSATLAASNVFKLFMDCGCQSTTGGGPYDYRVGRIRRVFNHVLTADNL